ncbi:MAG: hypothetical protein AABX08_02755 [Nanoarchaeota archaeon]
MIKSKRGAIELSITTIVVVVIGITLLTLGLTFVYNIFQDIGEQQKQITAFSDEKIREIFEGSEDYINIPATRIKIKIGESQTTDILVKNVGATTLNTLVLEWDIAAAAVPPAMGSRRGEIVGWFRSPSMTASGNKLTSAVGSLGQAFDKKLRYDISPTKGQSVPGIYTIPLTLKSGTTTISESFFTIELIS